MNYDSGRIRKIFLLHMRDLDKKIAKGDKSEEEKDSSGKTDTNPCFCRTP